MIELTDLSKFPLAHTAKVLVKIQDFEKCFLFVEALYHRRRKGNDILHKNYYMMWGNSFEEAQMAVTPLLKENGRKAKYSDASKLFFKAIKESRFLTFTI